jgi:hypothetical protein
MMRRPFRAFSSEVDAGSREENASKQKIRASALIQSKPMLWLHASKKAPVNRRF